MTPATRVWMPLDIGVQLRLDPKQAIHGHRRDRLQGGHDAQPCRQLLADPRPEQPAHGLPQAEAGCAGASVTVVRARRDGRFEVSVDAPADCPLTLATNYAESLQARVLVRGEWRDARTFPAYGALLGVWVPGGSSEVVVTSR